MRGPLRSRIAHAVVGLCLCFQAAAAPLAAGTGLFDVETRRRALATPPFAAVRTACMAESIQDLPDQVPVVKALEATRGYGSDTRAQTFAWVMMVWSGRALAGDDEAQRRVVQHLTRWASAGALTETEAAHDAYYALKRVLLPTVVAYSIVRTRLDPQVDALIRDWLDGLVRRVDRRFDGDVDHNNHRYLADSVLMTWGALVGDEDLYNAGLTRFAEVLGSARADGSLPLEARRGARAAWYQRQSLASLTVMAEVAANRGAALYEHDGPGGLDGLVGFLLNSIALPGFGRRYAAHNYIPGPDADYRKPDLGFLDRRSHGRHYMAWTEAYLAHAPDSTAKRRARALAEREVLAERPLIDEFSGGNATCFWARPEAM